MVGGNDDNIYNDIYSYPNYFDDDSIDYGDDYYNNDNYVATYYRVNMAIYSANRLKHLGSFTCETDGYSFVVWGDEY